MPKMFEDTVALVTGGNRGLGRAFADTLVARGSRVIVGARDAGSLSIPGAQVIELDITEPGHVSRLPELLPDVSLLVNNAGVHLATDVDEPECVETTRAAFEVNVFGLLAVTAALQERLVANGGTVVNVLSAGSWLAGPRNLAYSASKAAGLSLTNGMRTTLNPRGVQVTAVHAGFIDTDMMRDFIGPKLAAADVAKATLDAVADGAQEVLVDGMSERAKAHASAPVPPFERT